MSVGDALDIFDAAGPPLPQLSRTILAAGQIIGVVSGSFRFPGHIEVLVARKNTLQLYSVNLQPQRPLQPLFGEITDIQAHRAADCIGLKVDVTQPPRNLTRTTSRHVCFCGSAIGRPRLYETS
jgi:hypothetical protein